MNKNKKVKNTVDISAKLVGKNKTGNHLDFGRGISPRF